MKIPDNIIKIEYDGKYPNLCAGVLTVTIGIKKYKFEKHSLHSTGGLDHDYKPIMGEWEIENWPEDFPDIYKEQVVELVNYRVPHGCCGGCA